jgi:hypothetical protein
LNTKCRRELAGAVAQIAGSSPSAFHLEDQLSGMLWEMIPAWSMSRLWLRKLDGEGEGPMKKVRPKSAPSRQMSRARVRRTQWPFHSPPDCPASQDERDIEQLSIRNWNRPGRGFTYSRLTRVWRSQILKA